MTDCRRSAFTNHILPHRWTKPLPSQEGPSALHSKPPASRASVRLTPAAGSTSMCTRWQLTWRCHLWKWHITCMVPTQSQISVYNIYDLFSIQQDVFGKRKMQWLMGHRLSRIFLWLPVSTKVRLVALISKQLSSWLYKVVLSLKILSPLSTQYVIVRSCLPALDTLSSRSRKCSLQQSPSITGTLKMALPNIMWPSRHLPTHCQELCGHQEGSKNATEITPLWPQSRPLPFCGLIHIEFLIFWQNKSLHKLNTTSF